MTDPTQPDNPAPPTPSRPDGSSQPSPARTDMPAQPPYDPPHPDDPDRPRPTLTDPDNPDLPRSGRPVPTTPTHSAPTQPAPTTRPVPAQPSATSQVQTTPTQPHTTTRPDPSPATPTTPPDPSHPDNPDRRTPAPTPPDDPKRRRWPWRRATTHPGTTHTAPTSHTPPSRTEPTGQINPTSHLTSPTVLPEARRAEVQHSTSARRGMAALLVVITIALTVVISAPFALSSQDLVRWATSPDGLGLAVGWGVFVFVALDLAAASLVMLTVYSAWRGESAGIFGLLVWVFAAGSAWANYRHGLTTPAPDDAIFFAAMSLAGPLLLEVTTRRTRRWARASAGRYEHPLPHFRLARWLPGVAFRETVRALKLAITEGYSRPEEAVAAARIWRAVRRRDVPEKTPVGITPEQILAWADLLRSLPPDTPTSAGDPPPVQTTQEAAVDPSEAERLLAEQAGRWGHEDPQRLDDRPPLAPPDRSLFVDRSNEPPPVVPEPVDRSEPEETEPVDPDEEETTEPVNPTGRKALDPARLEEAYRLYADRLLARQSTRMTASQLAPVLDVTEDRARAIRRTKLDRRFLAEHPDQRLRIVG